MNKSYTRINWENYPSDATPVNEQNLNKIDSATDEIDNRVISLDTSKFDKTEAGKLIKNISLNKATGVFTITYYNGGTFTIDTLLEKIAVNFDYDPETQQIILTLDDGEIKYIDLSALITQYEFLDSDTVAFSIDKDGKVTAIVKEGSIEEKHLRPNYLADIKVESAKAEASAKAAYASEGNAKESETNAKASEANAKTSEENAKTSETEAGSKAEAAESSAKSASDSATAAEDSATAAADSAGSASESASASADSAKSASDSAASATSSATTATEKATESSANAKSASDSAIESESYAHGGTGTRENEDIDNAKYYADQAKRISQGINGITPMGTVTFAELPTEDITKNAMYNISDAFVSDDRFLDGGGINYGAGNNVLYTSEGKWDVLAASSVTGIKGDKESTYRQGNVNLTPANIGALPTDGDSKDNTATFTTPSTRENIASGETHTTIFGKIAKFFADLKAVAFSGSYDDLSDKPTIPASVAVKGNAESAYRTGNVNLTPANIGAVAAVSGKTLSSNDFTDDDKERLDTIINIAYCTCSTSASTAAKVATLDSSVTNFELKKGTIAIVKYSYSNSASSCTLNVGGTGAKSIYYNTGTYTGSSVQICGSANKNVMYVYDGTYWVWVSGSYDVDTDTTYSNLSLGQGYGTCATAASTTAKVVTLSGYSLSKGGIVVVKFTYSVPASATLNVNSCGAKSIYHKGSAIAASVIAAGDIATFMYDGTNYVLVSVDTVSSSSSSGVTGVKGSAETSYRTGNVSLTAANVGAVSTSNIKNNDTTTSSGYVADARIVKTHGDEIDELNSKLITGSTVTSINSLSPGVYFIATETSVNPFSFWCTLVVLPTVASDFQQQIAIPFSSSEVGSIKIRVKDGGTWSSWKSIS